MNRYLYWPKQKKKKNDEFYMYTNFEKLHIYSALLCLFVCLHYIYFFPNFAIIINWKSNHVWYWLIRRKKMFYFCLHYDDHNDHYHESFSSSIMSHTHLLIRTVSYRFLSLRNDEKIKLLFIFWAKKTKAKTTTTKKDELNIENIWMVRKW